MAIINHSSASASLISGLQGALHATHSNSTKSGLLHVIAFPGENQFDPKEVGNGCK